MDYDNTNSGVLFREQEKKSEKAAHILELIKI